MVRSMVWYMVWYMVRGMVRFSHGLFSICPRSHRLLKSAVGGRLSGKNRSLLICLAYIYSALQ